MKAGQAYDPDERRNTPLAVKLKQRIRRHGPITTGEYIRQCLYDTEYGYYVHRPAIGRDGDFITAPEISQVFGELIGLWAAVVWRQMRSPAAFILVEYGPGRGTLMRDALHAARLVPEFLRAAQVHLIETSTALTAVQRETLRHSPGTPIWNSGVKLERCRDDVPVIVIGNEFIDTLPVEQFVRSSDGWLMRSVGIDRQGRLDFVVPGLDKAATRRNRDQLFGDAPEGAIAEGRHSFVDAMVGMAVNGTHNFAALFLDYGHMARQSGARHAGAPMFGDTLQAVRGHRYESVFASPGEADLTTQVDFSAVAKEARNNGLAVDGPAPQAEFLGSLGIMERASRLMAANPVKAGEIEMGVARLMSPTGMGSRFKAIGLRSPGLPPLPGFPAVDKSQLRP